MSGFFDVSLEDLLNAQVEVEKSKYESRLSSTATQPRDFNSASQPQNVQAQAASGKGSGISTKTMIIGGGVVAALIVGYMVMK